MTVTKVGASTQANAYKYHIKLVFTDSNNQIWTLDKDMDVYGWWIDCNRQTDPVSDMDPVAFTLESGTHNSSEGIETLRLDTDPDHARKVIVDGQLYILLPDGSIYTPLGTQVR